MNPIKRIVAIGPESTGKSTLCAQLADHFKTMWVEEYARQYLENRKEYTYDTLLEIAQGQILLEDKKAMELYRSSRNISAIDSSEHLQQRALLFVDTDLYVIQVWCEFVYNRCHNWILGQVATREYDGYLLCNTDLPWEQDGLREYPDKIVREKLFRYYKELMINQNVPWVEIAGNHSQRLQTAIEFVENLPNKG